MSDEEKKDTEESRRDFLDELEYLREQRNRSGLKKLTTAQRQRLLNNIYDSTLFALMGTIMDGNIQSGTGGAATLLEKSRIEMIELEQAQNRSESTDTSNHTMAYEYELPNGNDEIVEA